MFGFLQFLDWFYGSVAIAVVNLCLISILNGLSILSVRRFNQGFDFCNF